MLNLRLMAYPSNFFSVNHNLLKFNEIFMIQNSYISAFVHFSTYQEIVFPYHKLTK